MPPGHSRTRFRGALGRVLGLCVVLSSSALLSGCGSEDDNRPAQWSYIYPAIIQPSCATASCHSNFTRRAGVNFGYSDEAFYQMVCRHFVVTCPAAGATDPCTGMPVAQAAAPTCMNTAVQDSQVVHQMRAEGASRMPPDFALPDVDIRLIEAWIRGGAANN